MLFTRSGKCPSFMFLKEGAGEQIAAEGKKEPYPVASHALGDHGGVVSKDKDGGDSPQGIEFGDGTARTGGAVRDVRPTGELAHTGKKGKKCPAPVVQSGFSPID